MFNCSKCEALHEEVVFLRDQLKTMTDRLVALTDPRAYEAVHPGTYKAEEYYGSSTADQYVGYDEHGEKVLLDKA